MDITSAESGDIESLIEIEHRCFPSDIACKREKMKERIRCYPNHFCLLKKEKKTIAFLSGPCIDDKEDILTSFSYPGIHEEEGKYQIITSLCCLPAYRHQGYASLLLNHIIEKAKAEKRAGISLLCQEKRVTFYERAGFVKESSLLLGKEQQIWYQMSLSLNREDK